MPTFSEWLGQIAPTWLQGPGGKAMTTVIGSELDRATDLVTQAVQARFPGLAPLDGLALLGAERGIPQAPWETAGDYAAYLVRAWDAWQGTDAAGGGAGTPASILIAAHRVLGGGFTLANDLGGDPQAAAFVQWNGRYVQLYKDMRTPIFGWLDGCQTRPLTPTFLPTDLGSTLKLWLRGDLGITQSVGNVTAWADQSGNGNNVVNSGTVPYAASAINGMPGATFGAGYLRNTTQSPLSAGSPRTIFIVTEASTSTGGIIYSGRSGTPNGILFLPSSVVTGLMWSDFIDGTRSAFIPVPTINGVPLIVEATHAGTGSFVTCKLSGAAQTVTQSTAVQSDNGAVGFSVGDSSGSFIPNAAIAEVIVCDTVLSAPDEDRVRAYLASRYKIGAYNFATAPGWYDGTNYWARSWLMLPTPGGIITGTDTNGSPLTLGNESGNVLKARLNAEVNRWKGAREAYGGAWVTDSYNPRLDSGAPPGSDAWWVAQSAPVSYMLGWPPSSLDSNAVLGDGYMLDGSSSLFIAPA